MIAAAGLALVLAAGAATVWSLHPAGIGTNGADTTATTALTTSAIASKVSPGLVDVTSTLGYQHGTSAGTGMVLTSTGEVLTNNHVINGATSISVTDVGNGRTYQAYVVGYDQSDDTAVLQMRNASGLSTVNLGDSSTVSVGQRVVALGNAGGRGGAPSVATGKVTALNKSITAVDSADGISERLSGLIRTDAGIQPGDSGGPLVSRTGQVIGINTAASTGFPVASASASSSTLAFAIPIDKAESIASQIKAGQASDTVHLGKTAFLGVQLASAESGAGDVPGILPAGEGAPVAGVVTGSPAAQAGLGAGDSITSLGGHKVSSSSGIRKVLIQYHPGERITIGWADSTGQAHSTTVTLVAGPAG